MSILSSALGSGNTAMLGAGLLGGLMGGSSTPETTSGQNWWKYWKRVGTGAKTPTGPLGDVFSYYQNLFNDPYGEEFQNAWSKYTDEANRQYGTLSNNLSYQLAQRMGTSDSSSMPGLLGYLTRMQAQDENDWLRDYATTAKSNAGQSLMNIISQQMGNAGSYPMGQTTSGSGNNLSGLMQMLGYMYAQSQGGQSGSLTPWDSTIRNA